jgi:hypothetical protein
MKQIILVMKQPSKCDMIFRFEDVSSNNDSKTASSFKDHTQNSYQ